ncbi:hypothetical protein FQA39_LY19368 [Lamprigera yunnana]|nr:hypothetical protein FQA39_LY19368 [Lamprigera yunnana]
MRWTLSVKKVPILPAERPVEALSPEYFTQKRKTSQSQLELPMPNCTEEFDPEVLHFGRLGRRVVEGRFDGGSMTSDGGVMLLGQVDRKLGLMDAAARCITDPRSPLLIKHGVRDMLRQRVYGLALGWEDLNDHSALRQDVAMQTAVGVEQAAASAPTLCRLEKWADRASAWKLHALLVDQFIASFDSAPKELVLDFDATDNPLHGAQEGKFFHGYYDNYCYLPLYVFCGQQVLCAYLRPSNIDGARHAAAILKLLVRRLRQVWPDVRIIFRGDSGFCRQRIINWCERAGVHYIVGLARNARLQARVELAERSMQDEYERTQTKQRLIGEFSYAANSWPRERRVITRLEWGAQGCNPRFVVTNLAGEPQALYERSVLPARRGREPHQRSADRPVRHTHELPSAALQPTAHAAVGTGLRADRAAACTGSGGHRVGNGPGRHPARQAAQGGRSHHTQHTAHPPVSGIELAQRANLCTRDETAALTVIDKAAPGRRDDIKMAHSPSWGGGRCGQNGLVGAGGLDYCRSHAFAALKLGLQRVIWGRGEISGLGWFRMGNVNVKSCA